MSRIRKAGIQAAFGYINFGLGFISGILLVPLILKLVGARSYGLWLACGDLLAYSAMIDLGVLNILPWIVAEKDGQKDRRAIAQVLANGLFVSSIVAVAYLSLALLLWQLAVGLTSLDAAERGELFGPVLFLISGTALAFPLRTFHTVLAGLQDVTFSGAASLATWALNISLVLFLLLDGYGLYALASAAVVPQLALAVASFLRLRSIAPDLFKGWARPSLSTIFHLTREGMGAWLSGFGWRMISASNNIIVVALASPEAAVVYACSSKLGEVMMQMAWLLPDSGLVGLAQLSGEGRRQRVKEVTTGMLRLLLITSGGVACVILFFNPGFVSAWVGEDRFGGYGLNLLLAAAILGLSLTHGLVVTASVLGSRLQTGALTFIHGVFYVALAVVMGKAFGLRGIAGASLISTALVAAPMAARVFRHRTGMTISDLWSGVLFDWSIRITPLLILTMAVGLWIPRRAFLFTVTIAPLLGLLYLWHMRRLYSELPLPIGLRPWLVRMRLIPQE
ncbi:MAG TPA: hypothetical protein VJQ56_09580 [Blastocatellia bacterium]|nr:hypothetical protein [Blastocatellia bacterium]